MCTLKPFMKRARDFEHHIKNIEKERMTDRWQYKTYGCVFLWLLLTAVSAIVISDDVGMYIWSFWQTLVFSSLFSSALYENCKVVKENLDWKRLFAVFAVLTVVAFILSLNVFHRPEVSITSFAKDPESNATIRNVYVTLNAFPTCRVQSGSLQTDNSSEMPYTFSSNKFTLQLPIHQVIFTECSFRCGKLFIFPIIQCSNLEVASAEKTGGNYNYNYNSVLLIPLLFLPIVAVCGTSLGRRLKKYLQK